MTVAMKQRLNRFLLASLAIYLTWMAATYLLEGRINQMLHYDLAERTAYVVVANVLIGTLMPAMVLHQAILSKATEPEKLGFGSRRRRRLLAAAIAYFAGLAVFILRNPSADVIFALNVFAQVLPVSIAEVMICWALIGVSFELRFEYRGKLTALLMGIVASDLFFAIYHFAHSPPFNQIHVILFLLIPGLLTSLVFFFGRDYYAAILIQNFLGMTGVARAVDVEYFSQPLYPVYALALTAMLVLIALDLTMIRRCKIAS